MSPPNQPFRPEGQPEVFFSTKDTAKAVSYYARQGRLRRLGPRLYTTNVEDAPEAIVRRHVWSIVGGYFPGAVVVDRTALELQPAIDGSVTLATPERRSDRRLPGLVLRPRVGPGPVEGDAPFAEDLHLSSRPRAFLDNMRSSRSRALVARTLSQAEVEQRLDEYARDDPEELNKLRDQARELIEPLGAASEFDSLDSLIGRLHGTRPGELVSARGQARRRGTPFDPIRIEKLEALQRHLLGTAPIDVPERPGNDLSTFAFFEAYFSNYIEGTEFELEEAERIVFEGAIPMQRPQDAHDVLGTYQLIADPVQRRRTPVDAGDLIALLKDQHERLLRQRPEIGPGEFKRQNNRAGATHFVDWQLVEGTLRESYRLYGALPEGFPRAVYIGFLVSEVHPFVDGNGRISRVLMNSELTAGGLQRIIVTTADRGSYLSALRAMTHNGLAATLEGVFATLQRRTEEIDFSTVEGAERQLAERRAFSDPDD